MNDQLRDLQPKALWENFIDLNAIPRASKKEERVIEFVKLFADKLGLKASTDETGNVIVKKPATTGFEDRQIIVLQSHLDMVHQKNADTTFNFDTEGIEMYVDGDWVKARGTTLGADNGIGVASIMTLLASTDIPHPPLEALFTTDEETGMTGALALRGGQLDGGILLNLDTEEDDELTIGCAGGIDVTASGSYLPAQSTLDNAFKITLNGLAGGHSGVEIHKGKANANKLMNRLLFEIAREIQIELSFLDGGSLRNAIPRESACVIFTSSESVENLKNIIKNFNSIFRNEYSSTDPALSLNIDEADHVGGVVPGSLFSSLLNNIYCCPNGIYRMSPDIASLVQSSNNLARVLIKNGNWVVQCLARSAVDTEKSDLTNAIAAAFKSSEGIISFSGDYPGWEPKPGAAIVKLMTGIYHELFHDKPKVNAIHAGLECGIIGANYPDLQMISFGPNIYGAHSPDERVQVTSVQKYWSFLLETLKRIPVA